MRPWIVGHRGASEVAPENTLAAFERAFRDGADGVELDVTLSSEGVPVVIHDDTLARTTGAPGFVWKKSVFELKTLDAGAWKSPAYQGERIPTLAEALDLAKGRGLVNVEVKSSRVAAHNGGPSPRPRVLRHLSRRAPDLRRGFLRSHAQMRPWSPWAMWARPDFLHMDVPLADEAANWMGGWEHVLVWTVDGPIEQERLFDLGARGVITNRPAEAKARLEARVGPGRGSIVSRG